MVSTVTLNPIFSLNPTIMKSHSLWLLGAITMTALSCQKATDIAGSGIDPDGSSVLTRTPPTDPLLDPDFSRGMSINNAGVIAGSTQNENGTVVAFRLGHQGLWLSGEPVSGNGLPEIKFALNDRGDLAGHYLVPGGIAPMVWKEGTGYPLQVLSGYTYGEVFDINASGMMVGECLNGNFVTPTAMRATLFTLDGDAIDLGTLGGPKSAASAVNDLGQIVGVAENAAGQSRAFLYQNGIMEDIGTLGGTTANANAINNRGEIAGRSFLANGAIRAFHYADGVMTDLGTLGGASSVAFDINDRGDIVGFSRIPNGQAHAFLYSDGVMTDLGALGGTDSRAISINNRGDITGFYTLNGVTHAFLYRDGVMIPL